MKKVNKIKIMKNFSNKINNKIFKKMIKQFNQKMRYKEKLTNLTNILTKIYLKKAVTVIKVLWKKLIKFKRKIVKFSTQVPR